MTIPESQLATWSNQGAVVTAQATHLSIRNALQSYGWPAWVRYDVCLQGSYRNFTNIYGNSDVDVVMEVTSFFYSNLTAVDKQALGLSDAQHNWTDFRKEVISALTSYYGSRLVDISGNKSVEILPDSGRLKADVVVAAQYGYYSKLIRQHEGITFWAQQSGEQVINYPKLHFDNGAAKNSPSRTGGQYRPCVRVFKNARERIVQDNPQYAGRFPSYFIEGLLYNVPDSKFAGPFQNAYYNVIDWLYKNVGQADPSKFVCQNGAQWLFGPASTQWNILDAREYVNQIIKLWNNW